MGKGKRVEHLCKTCGISFTTPASQAGVYCSKKCMWARNDTTRNCECCGKPFRSPPSQMHVRTCSTECGYKIRVLGDSRVSCTCKQCGKVFMEFPSHAVRREYCSLACRGASPEYAATRSAKTLAHYDVIGRSCIAAVSGTGKAYYRVSRERENANVARRRATKLQAAVAWGDKKKVDDFYLAAQRLSRELGVIYHVDHVVPLTSKRVCGLHNEFNLQLLPGLDNLRKHNRTWPNM